MLRRFVLYWLLFCVCGSLLAQEEAAKKDPPKRNSSDLPADSVFVVTPDLRKALETLGEGSIVLSAQRYKELIERLAALEKKKEQEDFLFTHCGIQAKPQPGGSRGMFAFEMELEYRTEKPNTSISVPLKGIRLTSALLDGEVPRWKWENEQLVFTVDKPRKGTLKLGFAVPAQVTSKGSRILLERIPMAAVTQLSVSVPGKVESASVTGIGAMDIEKLSGQSRLYSTALGPLSRLELAWEVETKEAVGTAKPGMSIQGQLIGQWGSNHLEMEGNFTLSNLPTGKVPFKLEFPVGSKEIKAELIRRDGRSSETLLLVQTGNTYQFTLPEFLGIFQEPVIQIRWQQPFPEGDAAFKWSVPKFVEPSVTVIQGSLQLLAGENVPLRIVPREMQRDYSEDKMPTMGQSRYRYRFQTAMAQLEITPLNQETRGLLSHSWKNLYQVREGDVRCVCELLLTEIKPARPGRLILNWPKEWTLQKELLQSAEGVSGVSQDIEKQEVTIWLGETDLTTPYRITLEGHRTLPVDNATFTWNLPRLLQAERGEDRAKTTYSILENSSQLKLQPGGMAIDWKRLEGISLVESLAGREKVYRVEEVGKCFAEGTMRPDTPLVPCEAVLYLLEKEYELHQTFRFSDWKSQRRPLRFVVPEGVTVRFSRPGRFGMEEVAGKKVAEGRELEVEVPNSSESEIVLEVVSRESMTVPGTLKLQPVYLSPTSFSHDKTLGIRCKAVSGISFTGQVAVAALDRRIMPLLSLGMYEGGSLALRAGDEMNSGIRSAMVQVEEREVSYSYQFTQCPLRVLSFQVPEGMVISVMIEKDGVRKGMAYEQTLNNLTQSLNVTVPLEYLREPVNVIISMERSTSNPAYTLPFPSFQNGSFPVRWQVMGTVDRWLSYSSIQQVENTAPWRRITGTADNQGRVWHTFSSDSTLSTLRIIALPPWQVITVVSGSLVALYWLLRNTLQRYRICAGLAVLALLLFLLRTDTFYLLFFAALPAMVVLAIVSILRRVIPSSPTRSIRGTFQKVGRVESSRSTPSVNRPDSGSVIADSPTVIRAS